MNCFKVSSLAGSATDEDIHRDLRIHLLVMKSSLVQHYSEKKALLGRRIT